MNLGIERFNAAPELAEAHIVWLRQQGVPHGNSSFIRSAESVVFFDGSGRAVKAGDARSFCFADEIKDEDIYQAQPAVLILDGDRFLRGSHVTTCWRRGCATRGASDTSRSLGFPTVS